jgi:hypothetical protein
MDYRKIYNQLIARAKDRVFEPGLYEKHHSIPKSLGGSNKRDNIVLLTYREHFLAHWLLVKFTEGDDKKKMNYALNRLVCTGRFHINKIITGWQYEKAKLAQREAMVGNSHAKGKPKSLEARENMRAAWKTRPPITETTRQKQRQNMIGNQHGRSNKGKPKRDEWKLSMSNGGNGRAKPVKCVNDDRVFPCIKSAAEFYEIRRGAIAAVCAELKSSVKGLSFVFIC